MQLTIECEQEVDGRWIAEIVELPGVMVYGNSAADAQTRVKELALRVIAEQVADSATSAPVLTFSLSPLA